MKRVDIINKFIATRGYTSYCEVGVARGDTFRAVRCRRKVGVDPDARSAATVHTTSDNFFACSCERFDVVFIDGLHSSGQVSRDIRNALDALNPRGVVILHDCLPPTAAAASPTSHGGMWCGDVYRAVAWYFSGSPYLCYTVDTDFGCGVIDTACEAEGPASPLAVSDPGELSYDMFSADRDRLMRVVQERDFNGLVARGIVRREFSGHRPLYVITPTGDRPDTFSMCVEYVNRQTVKPDMWLVVDDGKSDTTAPLLSGASVPHRLIRRAPGEGNTLLANLGAALEVVPDSALVCVMEDDDWYPRDYLETVRRLLRDHDYVAIRQCHYYHIPTRQYRILGGTPTHGSAWAGPGLTSIRAWVGSGILPSFDNRFSQYWCGTVARHDCIPGHILGFGGGRPGSTPSHRISPVARGWTSDPDGRQLEVWVGDDAWRYLGEAKRKVYVISNVDYPRENRLAVGKRDLLVFLNSARSLDYYPDHDNKMVYHRSPKREYGEERLCVKNRYVFDAGALSIPDSFIKALKAKYDWNYPIEAGKVKSLTTGYMVTLYMEHLYPSSDIILVNFGYSVAKSTYRCPWHNWKFEARVLSRFKHVFTAPTLDDGDASRHMPEGLDAASGVRTLAHVSGGVASLEAMLSSVTGRTLRMAVVGSHMGRGAKGLMALLPTAMVVAVGCREPDPGTDGTMCVPGDGCAAATWRRLPSDFDMVAVNAAAFAIDVLVRGVPMFAEHLVPGGALMVEGVQSEGDVERLLRDLPGAVCLRNTVLDISGSDRVVVYVK